MQKLPFDEWWKSRLNGLNDEVELLDAAGRSIGYFVPPAAYRKLMYAWAREQFSDEEEFRRCRDEPGGMTTGELLTHLREVASRRGRAS